MVESLESTYPRIGVVETEITGKHFTPEPGNPENGILESLRERGITVLSAGTHTLMDMVPTAPHHPNGGHHVYWTVEPDGQGSFRPWTDVSWGDIAADTDYLNAIESFVKSRRETYPDNQIYFFKGFVPPEADIGSHPVHAKGLQTQMRLHIHEVPPITPDVPRARYLSPGNERDELFLNLFFNTAGEAAIKAYEGELRDYGHRFSYTQSVGEDTPIEISRTMFGFPSLESALSATIELERTVAGSWLITASALAGSTPDMPYLPHYLISAMQSAVPSFVFMFPNDNDRKNGRTDNTDAVWVMPFSVANAQNVLIPGGVTILRKERQAQTDERKFSWNTASGTNG